MVLHHVILKMNLMVNLIDNGTHYSCKIKKYYLVVLKKYEIITPKYIRF